MLYTPSFLAMAFANFFTVSSFHCFVLLPLFISRHGGSKADIGVIMGALALAAVFCRPWISEMIDRIGRKKSYTIGSLIMTLSPLTYLSFTGPLSDFYLPLLFVRIVHGVGLAICFTAIFTYVADIIPKDRLNEGVGMFGISGLTGMAVGPVIAELMKVHFGFPGFFLGASGIACLGLVSHLPLRESFVHARQRTDTPSFFLVLKRERTLNVALFAFLFGFGIAASGGFVSPYAEERQIPFISLYYLSYSFAAILSRVFGGRVADRVGEEQILPPAMILTGTGLLLMILLRGNGILILSGLLTGCGHGLLFPSLNSLAIRDEPIGIRGKIMGVFTGGIDAGAFMGAIILGYIGEWAGFPMLFLASGLAFWIGFGVFQFRMRKERRGR